VLVLVVVMSVEVTVRTEDYTVSLDLEVPRFTVGGTDDENVPSASVAVLAIALSSKKKKVTRTFVFVFFAFAFALDSEPSRSSTNIEESVKLVGLSNGDFEPWLLHHIQSIFHFRSNSTRPAPPPLFVFLQRFFNRPTHSQELEPRVFTTREP
jgi:hypothetical protein